MTPDLQQWIQGLHSMLDAVLKHPETPFKWWVLLSAAILACAIVLHFTVVACNLDRRPAFGYAVLVSVVGLALILLGMTAGALLLGMAGGGMLVAAGVGISLLLVIPMIYFLMKANSLVAFFAWLISLGAVAGVIAMLSAGFDAVTAGTEKAGKVKGHKHDLEQILGNPREVNSPIRK